ncbi:MAG: hypothetical protein KAX28_06880, partial [Candidatus Marinimicrobia bacterium]|nr:hypothetical protein [Candidatus Neomarinimicrobiota bacterium]
MRSIASEIKVRYKINMRSNASRYKSIMKVVGKSVEKIDSLSLSTGCAKFYDDFHLPDEGYVKFLYSPHAHAKILSIDASKAKSLNGVIDILHYGNVPRILHTTAGQGYPEPSPYDAVMFDSTMR